MGLPETVPAFAVLGVEVLVGLGVSFEDRGASFAAAFGVVAEATFGVVGVAGAFNLLPDRVVALLFDGNLFGVPIKLMK